LRAPGSRSFHGTGGSTLSWSHTPLLDVQKLPRPCRGRVLFLRALRCRRPDCRRSFAVCLRCDRWRPGHCSAECEQVVLQRRWRANSAAYQLTAAGIANHRKRNANYKREQRQVRRAAKLQKLAELAEGVTHRELVVAEGAHGSVKSAPILPVMLASAGTGAEEHRHAQVLPSACPTIASDSPASSESSLVSDGKPSPTPISTAAPATTPATITIGRPARARYPSEMVRHADGTWHARCAWCGRRGELLRPPDR